MLSLRMVGALSTVRFRTAVKDAIDIAFIFWPIIIGIVCGAGMITVAVLSSILIWLIVLITSKHKHIESNYILIGNIKNNGTEEQIYDILQQKISDYKIQSKQYQNEKIEIIIDLRIKDKETKLLNHIEQQDVVEEVKLLSYRGDSFAL